MWFSLSYLLFPLTNFTLSYLEISQESQMKSLSCFGDWVIGRKVYAQENLVWSVVHEYDMQMKIRFRQLFLLQNEWGVEREKSLPQLSTKGISSVSFTSYCIFLSNVSKVSFTYFYVLCPYWDSICCTRVEAWKWNFYDLFVKRIWIWKRKKHLSFENILICKQYKIKLF